MNFQTSRIWSCSLETLCNCRVGMRWDTLYLSKTSIFFVFQSVLCLFSVFLPRGGWRGRGSWQEFISDHLSIYLSINVSIYISIYLYMYLSIYISIYSLISINHYFSFYTCLVLSIFFLSIMDFIVWFSLS